MDCDKTEERSVQIFIPYERSLSLVFCEVECLVGRPYYLKFWVKLTTLERNRRFSVDIRAFCDSSATCYICHIFPFEGITSIRIRYRLYKLHVNGYDHANSAKLSRLKCAVIQIFGDCVSDGQDLRIYRTHVVVLRRRRRRWRRSACLFRRLPGGQRCARSVVTGRRESRYI